jgi:hypothetical protein
MGSVVFKYDGFRWFETMIAGMACQASSFTKNALLSCPNGDQKAMKDLTRVGVRLSSAHARKTFAVNNDAPDPEVISMLCQGRWPNKKSLDAILVEEEGLRLSDQWRGRFHASSSVQERSLEEVPSSSARAMLTTSWRASVLGAAMGMKVMLLSGPSHPSWVDDVASRAASMRVIKVRDRDARRSACPCSSVSRCHSPEGEVRPCLSVMISETLAPHRM